MSILQFFLLLAVGGAIIWGVIMALAGKWKEIFIGIVILIVALWILAAMGLTLPNLPTLD